MLKYRLQAIIQNQKEPESPTELNGLRLLFQKLFQS